MLKTITTTLGAVPPEPMARSSNMAVEVDHHRALAIAAQKGDRKAFTGLVELYQQTIYGFLRARLTDQTVADDLCQEVFLRCFVGREKLARAAEVGPWLIGIARNLLREHARKLTRRKEVMWTELCLELDALVMDREGENEHAMAHLPQCLASLGESAREAIDLRYRSQLRWGEIGLRLRRSEGAVKLLVHRARQALKNCLDHKLKVS